MSGLVLVFDLDDTLYPERQYALSGFKAAERWAAPELGIEGLAADMTRLLDDGHLGALFRMALARKLPELPSQRVGRQPCASGGTMQKERASNRPVGGQLAITDNFCQTGLGTPRDGFVDQRLKGGARPLQGASQKKL